MDTEKKYVSPSTNKSDSSGISNLFNIIKDVFRRVESEFWFSLILRLIIVIPFVFFTYAIMLESSFGSVFGSPSQGIGLFIGQVVIGISTILLTFIAGLFYPYSIYWYSRSSFNRFFSNLIFFGGFFEIILKKLLMLFGHILLAGILSPIMGVITWRRFKKENTKLVRSEL